MYAIKNGYSCSYDLNLYAWRVTLFPLAIVYHGLLRCTSLLLGFTDALRRRTTRFVYNAANVYIYIFVRARRLHSSECCIYSATCPMPSPESLDAVYEVDVPVVDRVKFAQFVMNFEISSTTV